MMTDQEKLLELCHQDDLMADLASAIESRGARVVLAEFEVNYPQHYHELRVQMNRKHIQIPALFKAKEGWDG